MKLKYCYLLFIVVFALSSCVKHDDIYQSLQPESTADLEVPAGFDWSSTQAVSLSITSPSMTVASFYSDASCSLETQIGVLPVPEGKTTYRFELPYLQKAIFVQYVSEDGTTKTIKSEIGQSGTKAFESDNIIFIEPRPSISDLTLNIPSTGKYGTIMFEDTWPDTGDYDFNDVVVNQKINCKSDRNDQNIYIRVSLKIRALGGKNPYDFGIQIGTWTSGSYPFRIPASDMVGITDINKTNDQIEVKALNTEYPGVLISGLNSLRKPDYYNTVTKEDEGVQIDFTVVLKGSVDEQWQRIQGLADPKAFDYFLCHENGREIHMMGYAPTSLYAKQYDEDVADKGGDIYYQNSKGLVWALKAPAEIGWPSEKNDITGVYTRFAEWVRSGGSLIGSDGYDPLIWYDFHTDKNYIKP